MHTIPVLQFDQLGQGKKKYNTGRNLSYITAGVITASVLYYLMNNNETRSIGTQTEFQPLSRSQQRPLLEHLQNLKRMSDQLQTIANK